VIEQVLGWAETVGTTANTLFQGTPRVATGFKLNLTSCNLLRLPKLLANSTQITGQMRLKTEKIPRSNQTAAEMRQFLSRKSSIVH
jgi:hypothetical protein